MTIRFQVSKPLLAGRERDYALDAIESGWISGSGAYVDRFEASVSSFLGLEGGLAVASGTAALHLACLAMGLRPGMDVIVPSLTYVATANAVAYCGARPVLADVDASTWNVSRESIEVAWTPRTVGVVCVHLYGLPAPAAEISAWCRSRGAWLIEDCAESLGAKINEHSAGSFGDAAALSFFGNKIISTGEGGMLFVRDATQRQLAKVLRGQGMDLNRRYWHPLMGYNYRLTNVAAAIGVGQMEMVDYHLRERRRIADRYRKNLQGFERAGLLRLPVEPVGYHHAHWLFSIVLARGGGDGRDDVRRQLLDAHGIETRPFFVPMHRLPMYETGAWQLPVAEFLGEHGISLPTYSGLSDGDVDEICAALSAVIGERFGS